MGKVGFRTSTQPTSLNYHGKQTPKNMGKVGFCATRTRRVSAACAQRKRTSTQPTSLMRNCRFLDAVTTVIAKLSEKKLINDRL